MVLGEKGGGPEGLLTHGLFRRVLFRPLRMADSQLRLSRQRRTEQAGYRRPKSNSSPVTLLCAIGARAKSSSGLAFWPTPIPLSDPAAVAHGRTER